MCKRCRGQMEMLDIRVMTTTRTQVLGQDNRTAG